MISKEFVLAGNAVFTIEVPTAYQEKYKTKPHYTFKVTKPKDETPFHFVSMLTGPDNTNDYTYMGILWVEKGNVSLTKKSKYRKWDSSVIIVGHAVKAIWEGRNTDIGGWQVHHEGQCGRCGRALTVPESVKSGFGPECVKKVINWGSPVVTTADIISNADGVYDE